jgi:hypothetical protein
LSVAGQSRDATVNGAGTNLVVARFGPFEIREPGYHRFALESRVEAGRPFGDLDALLLDGAAVEGAHFNLRIAPKVLLPGVGGGMGGKDTLRQE